MLNYVPPEAKLKKKNKKKSKDESTNNGENENEDLGTADDTNLNLEVGFDVPDHVRNALSQLDERQIPIDVILVSLLFIFFC
jgi:hypothetical protein